ncbi:NAD-dependent epimerase/dehydratase family protein [Streptomyces sp. AK08-02]|uniref:NAD-dependent epimerase/dehydratase family protein n=1 Tax=Streptomyces sp. AK08-02 TaxID=3028654 RepID=UPI0029B43D79|nr:NAD-dependent epimerase/dehydratase family protein [Streptomyces sp. AK08-02]MDX3753229.1 NAD-dependent epimerase/dehydratase family protein [Streptomyces sp. AK08-02]
MTSVVVLGGAGYVGRHVCAAFAARGHEVVAVGRRPAEDPLPYRTALLDLAETGPGELGRALRALRPSVVVNSVGSIWGRTDAEMWSATAVPVLRLLDALGRMPDTPRLVHLGSVLEFGPVPSGTRVSAAVPARPDTAYGRGKLAATEAVLRAAAEGRVDGTVLRVSNVCGPGTPGVSLLGRVAGQLLAASDEGREAVVKLTRMSARRDYVDVRDVADAVVAAASAPAVPEPLGIGRGEAVPVRDLVDVLVTASGIPASVVELPPPPGSPGGGADWLCVDTAAVRTHLGWQPPIPLAESVRDGWLAALRTHRTAPPSTNRSARRLSTT